MTMHTATASHHLNWPVRLVVALLMLLAANVASTQFVAHRLHYHQALGHPIVAHLYRPWRWISWKSLRMFMKVHSVFTKVHSRGTVLRARRLRLPHTPPRGAVCAGGV